PGDETRQQIESSPAGKVFLLVQLHPSSALPMRRAPHETLRHCKDRYRQCTRSDTPLREHRDKVFQPRSFNRLAITFAAVAPAPVAPLIVGAKGFDTSPTPNTIGTFVSCRPFTTKNPFSSVSSWFLNSSVFGSTPIRISTPRTAI